MTASFFLIEICLAETGLSGYQSTCVIEQYKLVSVCVCHSSSPSLLDAMRSRSQSLPQLQHVSAPGGWSSLIGGVGSAAWLDGTVSAGRE